MSDVEVISGPPRFTLDQIRRVVAAACARTGAQRALLFGSYARGTADSMSDVDLILVCATELPFVERFRLFPEIFEAFTGADLLVYTPQEFEEMRVRSGFVEKAEREGVVVYEAPAAPS